jgi:hypothetical protein
MSSSSSTPRVPATLRASQARSLKTKCRKANAAFGLKAFVRALKDDVGKAQAEDWFHNKRANCSRPLRGIGRTRMRVKKGGGGAPHKDLSGR